MPTTVERSIDLTVPVTTAYIQWTQFESFPQFMESVVEVNQIGDDLTEWHTDVNGIDRKFTARITEQTPDQQPEVLYLDAAGAIDALFDV